MVALSNPFLSKQFQCGIQDLEAGLFVLLGFGFVVGVKLNMFKNWDAH